MNSFFPVTLDYLKTYLESNYHVSCLQSKKFPDALAVSSLAFGMKHMKTIHIRISRSLAFSCIALSAVLDDMEYDHVGMDLLCKAANALNKSLAFHHPGCTLTVTHKHRLRLDIVGAVNAPDDIDHMLMRLAALAVQYANAFSGEIKLRAACHRFRTGAHRKPPIFRSGFRSPMTEEAFEDETEEAFEDESEDAFEDTFEDGFGIPPVPRRPFFHGSEPNDEPNDDTEGGSSNDVHF